MQILQWLDAMAIELTERNMSYVDFFLKDKQYDDESLTNCGGR